MVIRKTVIANVNEKKSSLHEEKDARAKRVIEGSKKKKFQKRDQAFEDRKRQIGERLSCQLLYRLLCSEELESLKFQLEKI